MDYLSIYGYTVNRVYKDIKYKVPGFEVMAY